MINAPNSSRLSISPTDLRDKRTSSELATTNLLPRMLVPEQVSQTILDDVVLVMSRCGFQKPWKKRVKFGD